MENMLLNHEVKGMEADKNRIVEINIQPKLKIEESDIYTGEEVIRFNNRHPIFKALMKLEFEEVIRNYHKRISSR